jgi:hypothetical protein
MWLTICDDVVAFVNQKESNTVARLIKTPSFTKGRDVAVNREKLFRCTEDILESRCAVFESLHPNFTPQNLYTDKTKHTFHIAESYGVSSLSTNGGMPYLLKASSLYLLSEFGWTSSKQDCVRGFAAIALKGQ